MNRVALLTAAALLSAGSAQAVTQTAGFLEIDDPNDKATIDINFFSISNVEDVEFQFDIRSGIDPLATETLAAHLWSVDAGGNLDALIASEMTPAGMYGFHMNRFGADQLAVGDYAFVVGTKDLGTMEFPPFQMDAATPAGITFVEYEISTTTGENALAHTCQIAGNLDGTTTKNVFSMGTQCNVPTAKASEPGTLAAMGGGLAFAGLVWARRRQR